MALKLGSFYFIAVLGIQLCSKADMAKPLPSLPVPRNTCWTSSPFVCALASTSSRSFHLLPSLLLFSPSKILRSPRLEFFPRSRPRRTRNKRLLDSLFSLWPPRPLWRSSPRRRIRPLLLLRINPHPRPPKRHSRPLFRPRSFLSPRKPPHRRKSRPLPVL